ncbi:putative ATP-dependent helicase C23E6.02 [Hypsizygus marmoreus]|uniref:ATP-dependent helicase C23E6.02 n=1 Tax=Hypsizygus marmoreus TaxID=39966 RepID=A0A369JQ53_HYPMA|nr:putative ATP-dependent helicase C23E6.02 [Hypsizygus marmoreus]
MASGASTKYSSLLDALDSSFSCPGVSDAKPPSNLKPPATLDAFFQPRGSSSAKAGSSQDVSRALEQARASQRQSLAGSSSAAGDGNFLASALARSPAKQNVSGFRLNYDHETPIRSIDLGGPDQQQRMAEFVTKSIDNLSHGLTVKSAMKALGLKDQKDFIPGMEVRLLSHQAIGVAWMLAKEESSDRGGILADDMGLGKTVQMIATMVKNQPKETDEHKTTLIIVPAALLQQWKDEIESKTNGVFTVHLHHGRDKLKKLSHIKNYDVIITTYQTLNQDFGIPRDVDTAEEAEWLADNGGILARAKFYRAVADEAQFIRNRATRSSISLAHVRAKYRWMLTGTPVTNTLADIYGLLRFGRFRPWNDWVSFDSHIAKVQSEDAPLAGSRAQAILKPILLRRTKDSTLEGKPILELPPKSIEMVKLQFSEEERDLYDSFEKRTKIRLNKFIRERTLISNHAAVLVMILRLRQLCCHPHLILSQSEGYDDPTLLVGSESDKELGRARKIMGSAWVADVKRKALTRARASEVLDFSDELNAPESSCPVCQDLIMNDSGRVLACGHEICFDCLLDLSNSPIAHNGIFGEGSEKENLAAEKEYETGAAKGYRPCPTCKKMMDLTPNKVFRSSAFEPTDEELTNHPRATRRGKSRVLTKRTSDGDVKMRSPSPERSFEERGLDDSDDDLPDVSSMLEERPVKKQRKNMRIDDDDENDTLDLTMDEISVPVDTIMGSTSDFEIEFVGVSHNAKKKANESRNSSTSPKTKGKRPREDKNGNDGPSQAVIATWGRGDDDMEPSAKMLALMELLKKWESTGDKTIVYSQWTSMLDLIDILFSRHGIQSLRFDGKMDRYQRDAVLTSFKTPGGAKVILISTKCGSVGLNLVAANRIVNMDLSWNYAAESQAYDRVHRIGQEKDVFVKRLVVENTIEERMLLLQDVKVGLAEAALGEGTGAKLHKLSVKDIKYLFGMTPAKKDGPVNGTAGH